MDKKQLEHELSAAKKENPNVIPFSLIARNLFDHRTPLTAIEFTLHCYKKWKPFPEIRSMDDPEAFVQKAAEIYGKDNGIDVLQYWNDEIVVPVVNYIIKNRLGFKTIGAFKEKHSKLYKTIKEMVGEYLWESKPLRGYYEMPASVEYLGNTVFSRKIERKLSEDDLKEFDLVEKAKTCHVRDSDAPIEDVEAQDYILELLKSRPMEKFSSFEVAECVRIGDRKASDNLKWLAGHGSNVIAVKPTKKHGRVNYKWCLEAHMIDARPKGKMQIISKVLYRLLNQNPGTTTAGARTLLRIYFGNMDSNTADQALDVLKESGLVKMVPDKSHKQRFVCVVQARADDKDKALVRLAAARMGR